MRASAITPAHLGGSSPVAIVQRIGWVARYADAGPFVHPSQDPRCIGWSPRCCVAGSSGSCAASTFSRIAASRTVRVIGPAVSWLCAIGRMPARLTRPTVGFTVTTPFWLAG